MTLPYHKSNVMTGFKSARLIDDANKYAALIKKAKRPLLVVGPRCLSDSLDGRPLLDWALDVAQAIDMPICATAHTRKELLAREYTPASSYDLIEILHSLTKPTWKGVKSEGNHDLVLFFGIRSDLATGGLSTLKHYAPHLKTMTLCKYYFPHADYSLPNFSKDEKWRQFLSTMIEELRNGN